VLFITTFFCGDQCSQQKIPWVTERMIFQSLVAGAALHEHWQSFPNTSDVKIHQSVQSSQGPSQSDLRLRICLFNKWVIFNDLPSFKGPACTHYFFGANTAI
jgi:hypothetical protein